MATSSKSGMSIVVDTRSLSRLAKDLRRAAPDAWKAYRVTVRTAAQPVLDDAKANASYSTRIPATGRIRTTAGGNVKITFGGEAAPDAAPIENGGRGFVRHPTFGRRGQGDWTSKNSRPAFLAPAFDKHREQIADAIEAAVVGAVERAIRGGL